MASAFESKLTNAVGRIVRAALSKEAAMHTSEPLRRQIIARADQTIAFIVDEFSGAPGHTKATPKPMPGPSNAALELAISLVATANFVVRSDQLRDELTKLAARITESAYANAGLRID